MQYDPIKKKVGRVFSGPVFMRKIFYFFLDLLLLRAWHIRKELGKIAGKYSGKASVLDAGAGFGQYSWKMCRMNKKWKIKAVDIDPEHTINNDRFFRLAGLSQRVTCETIDLTGLDETGSFDFILSVDVMEHIKEDELVFRNFWRALKPGGSILISTPSDRGGSDVHSEDEQSFIDEHVRDGYAIEEISQKLEQAQFSNIKAFYTYGKPGTISWHLSMKYPVKMLNRSRLFYMVLPIYYLLILPFALILNFFDVLLIHKSGTGLLVSASKQQ
jgi:2-polyprenyl-3-methyl-5-hydroxy-6-metoxy-1,4-benzoquinol methylase